MGYQVISEIHRQGESMALRKAGDRTTQRVEDYRRPPLRIPVDRDYMKVQRLSGQIR